jgi:hypothetical protein
MLTLAMAVEQEALVPPPQRHNKKWQRFNGKNQVQKVTFRRTCKNH